MIETKPGEYGVAELREVVDGMSQDEAERALRGISGADENAAQLREPSTTRTIPGWPSFSKGELLDVKGIWFEVVGQRGGMMYLRPKGPTSALVKRIARMRGRK